MQVKHLICLILSLNADATQVLAYHAIAVLDA